jgi:hypothetical protein
VAPHEQESFVNLSPRFIRLVAEDQVAVAVEALAAGDLLALGGANVIVREAVPAGHKVSVTDIAAGDAIRKYGQPIGLATADIKASTTAPSDVSIERLPMRLGASRSAGPRALRARSRATSAPTAESGPATTWPSSRRSTARPR